MTEQRTPALHVGTDSHGRTWRVLEREDSFSVYYTVEGSSAHHVLYDSLDEWRDPPRVLLGRMQQAQREAAELRADVARLRAALENLIDAADNGEWHSSEDCRIEGRQRNDGGCELCTAFDAARAATTPQFGAEPGAGEGETK